MKTMIKVIAPASGSITYLVCNKNNVDQMLELLKKCPVEYSTFEVGKMPLEELPDEIQAKVKDVLKAFNRVSVTFEYNEFSVSTGACIRSSYSWDHFVCGYYLAKEVYTEEERRQNYIECFG